MDTYFTLEGSPGSLILGRLDVRLLQFLSFFFSLPIQAERIKREKDHPKAGNANPRGSTDGS